MLHPIRRIEITSIFLRVYLSLENSTFRDVAFYLITLDEGMGKRHVFKGHLPKKPGQFPLYEEGTGKEIKADFHGNRYGGDVLIFLEELPPTTKFFAKLEQKFGFADESEWHEIAQSNRCQVGVVALIPCYNVDKYCAEVVEETVHYASRVIVVDDGSTDNTKALLDEIAAKHPEKVYVLGWPDNRGKGTALLEGFKYAIKHFSFEALVTLDGDKQHRPSDIPYLVEEIRKGEELVIGARLFKLMPARSRFANRWIVFLLRLFYPSAPTDTQSGLRAFSKNMVEEIVRSVPGGRYEMEFRCLLLALHQRRRILSYPISTIYLYKNLSSHFSPLRDSLRILKILILHYFTRKKL